MDNINHQFCNIYVYQLVKFVDKLSVKLS